MFPKLPAIGEGTGGTRNTREEGKHHREQVIVLELLSLSMGIHYCDLDIAGDWVTLLVIFQDSRGKRKQR